MKTLKSLTALAAVAALSLSACSSDDSKEKESKAASSNATTSEVVTITVGASPMPHAKILRYINDELAADAGIKIEVREFQDYIQPNVALEAGDIDANFFQHIPYLEEEIASKGYTFEHGPGVHIEPYGIYSKDLTSLEDLPNGAKVAITNDPTNQERALKLLVANNLITLKDVESATIYDLATNPKNLEFVPADAPAVAKLLPDVDIAIINGNYALENNLTPSEDAIYLEDGEDNPYSNILAWNTKSDPAKLEAVKKLDELLHSDEVAAYIKENWPNGEVIPAF